VVLEVTFYGVRGSTPCASAVNQRYGGNTSCVTLEVAGEAPIVCDLGTGLRYWGDALGDRREPFTGAALVSHLHWDHVQGLPFFMPINRKGARLDIYGPHDDEGTPIGEAFAKFMRPPYFPIHVKDLTGEVNFVDVVDEPFSVGNARVLTRTVPHVGTTNGYRIEWGGASVAYVSDHQEPIDDPTHVSPNVLELAAGVDLLIHDAQFTPDELAERSTWGHCTVRYALEVARQSGAKALALFHHDPGHEDDEVDLLVAEAVEWAAELGVPNVFGASEGLKVLLGGCRPFLSPRRAG
jgi:phosphoribosyl 1,2-cyclic phosphodiesterase